MCTFIGISLHACIIVFQEKKIYTLMTSLSNSSAYLRKVKLVRFTAYTNFIDLEHPNDL